MGGGLVELGEEGVGDGVDALVEVGGGTGGEGFVGKAAGFGDIGADAFGVRLGAGLVSEAEGAEGLGDEVGAFDNGFVGVGGEGLFGVEDGVVGFLEGEGGVVLFEGDEEVDDGGFGDGKHFLGVAATVDEEEAVNDFGALGAGEELVGLEAVIKGWGD